jgi:hypothetical protein
VPKDHHGTERAGSRLRRDARKQLSTAIRANGRLIGGATVGYLTLVTVIVVALSNVVPPILLAFFAGAAIASLGWMVLYVCGGAEHRRLSDAALGEDFTSTELRRLPRGWAHLDNVEFHRCDVDHVLVGPGIDEAPRNRCAISGCGIEAALEAAKIAL